MMDQTRLIVHDTRTEQEEFRFPIGLGAALVGTGTASNVGYCVRVAFMSILAWRLLNASNNSVHLCQDQRSPNSSAGRFLAASPSVNNDSWDYQFDLGCCSLT